MGAAVADFDNDGDPTGLCQVFSHNGINSIMA
jgi:hypothetical protein